MNRTQRTLLRLDGLSLERKLPLLISLLLLLVVGAVLLVTAGEVTRAARTAANERLQRVAHQLASTVQTSTAQYERTLHPLTADTAMRRVLAGGAAPDDLESRVRSLLPQSDTLGVTLWGRSGRLIAQFGAAVPAGAPRETKGSFVPGRADSTRFGPLYFTGGHVYFWTVSPILAGTRRLGWIAEQRRIAASPRSERTIQSLIGQNVAVFFRNDTGSVWTTLEGSPARPPVDVQTRGGIETRIRPERPEAGRMLAAEAPIAGTPWTLALEAAISPIEKGARASVVRLGIFSLVLLLAGVVTARAISRRLTRPLAELTLAAESLARGDYASRVPDVAVARGDEIGRLAGSFNHMAAEVAASHAELEQQMEEAQALSEEIETANAQLEETTMEAEEARDAAEAARREAEAANQAKSRFLATMSHELRTPLNAIAGYAELMQMEIRGPVTREQHEDLERIRRSQRTLLALVEDVLSFAKLEAGRVEYRIAEIQLDDALAGVEALIAPQAAAKQITYEYHTASSMTRIWADQEKLERIVLNLLSNAVKFTDAGGRITLASEVGDSECFVRVADTGHGIAPEKLESIFEPFTQAETGLTRTREGTGLGLAISREFARAMGGELTVESMSGVGSTFTLRLPLRPAAAPVTLPAFAADGAISSAPAPGGHAG
ncbi:MAG TPA: ATP-binding protein [Gemmatimonadaceae bacterium]|nr:ATP-binding protein [Gemmatimonadaceae bacterium]